MSTIFREVLLFWSISIIFTASSLGFPQLALWLPDLFGLIDKERGYERGN